MSLDLSLHLSEPIQLPVRRAIFLRREGSTVEVSRAEWDKLHPDREPTTMLLNTEPTTEVFTANITHNLKPMAKAVNIYGALWEPGEAFGGHDQAIYLISPLSRGLRLLRAEPNHFKQFDSANGWGTYDDFVRFVVSVLHASAEYPDAHIKVSV